MESLQLGRLITAMVTPFAADGSVNYEVARQLVRHLLENGSDSLVVCGTTGESPTMTEDEKLRLFDVVKAELGNHPMICGTGTNSTAATLEFSKKAKDHGADAILVVTPYYNKPPQECIYEHFRTVAETLDMPVVAYNIPGRTGTEISPAVLARLASLPNIIAVKESLPSLEPVSQLQSKLVELGSEACAGYEKWTGGRAMAIYSGDDSAVLPMMSLGAAGVISVASHVAGKLMKQMMNAYLEGRPAEALDMHLRLYPLLTGLFATTNPILVKAALQLQGIPVGGLRMPLRACDDSQLETLRRLMIRVGVL